MPHPMTSFCHCKQRKNLLADIPVPDNKKYLILVREKYAEHQGDSSISHYWPHFTKFKLYKAIERI